MLRSLLLVLPLCSKSSKIFVPGQDRRAIRHVKVTDASPTRVALEEYKLHPYFDNNVETTDVKVNEDTNDESKLQAIKVSTLLEIQESEGTKLVLEWIKVP